MLQYHQCEFECFLLYSKQHSNFPSKINIIKTFEKNINDQNKTRYYSRIFVCLSKKKETFSYLFYILTFIYFICGKNI